MILCCALVFFYQLALLGFLIRGSTKLSKLKAESSLTKAPTLSIVVPARNEEDTIETGLRSLLKCEYPHLEIIVVNDRSTDGTLQRVESLSQNHPEVKILNLQELPENWLGKNHALQRGAEQSTSELILFTDADVEIGSDFLKKAVCFFEEHELDHLGGIPKVTSRSLVLYPLVGVFGLGFSLFTRPWEGKDPSKDRAVGIGAFNLVRRSAYQTISGHQSLAMRPDDDLKLALVLKRAGFKTDCVNGVEGMEVEWYPSFISLVRGLEKNVMTGFEYDFRLAFVGLFFYAATFVLPFALPFLTEGTALAFSLLAATALFLSYLGQLYLAKLPLWCVPFLPLASPVIFSIFVRDCFLTYIRRGVIWRGTFYSLQSLRANRMRLPGSKKSNLTG
jgi:cellulose synthase/poly-beta-1,6-N-acetylglucosamine synthase-like glycosyltransferase